jgi:hypothetical protein
LIISLSSQLRSTLYFEANAFSILVCTYLASMAGSP